METSSEESSERDTLGTRAEIEALDACKRRIKAAIPADKVRDELDKSYRELGRSVQLPGFRPGRVPRRLLEARFGEEMEKQLKESLVGTSFAEVVDEKKLKVIGAPKFDNVELRKDADLTYDVELEVQPEFQLGEYKGVEVTREVAAVTEDAIQEQLLALRRTRSRMAPIDLSDAGPEDHYYGRYQLFRQGARVKTSETIYFKPSSGILDVFSVADLPERVKGWDPSSGAPLKLDVRVPADFTDEVLRNADVQLEFALDEVRRMELPELDDDFAKDLGNESLAQLRGEVEESLKVRAKRREDARIEESILEKVAAATSMDLPEGLLESQRRRWRARREYELLVEQGLTPEKAKEDLEKEGQAAAEDLRRELKAYFILERIADEEKIFATEDEVDDRLGLLARYHGVPPGRLREEMRESGRLEDLRQSIRHEKVRAFLRRKARVLGPDGQPEAQESPPAPDGVESPESPESQASPETAETPETRETSETTKNAGEDSAGVDGGDAAGGGKGGGEMGGAEAK